MPLVLAGLFGLAVLSMTGRELILPEMVTAAIEGRMTAAAQPWKMQVGQAALQVAQDGPPWLTLRNLSMRDGSGADVGQVAELSVALSADRLWRGEVRPTRIGISGAQVTARRAADGTFALSLGGGTAAAGNVIEIIDAVDRVFRQDPLDRIAEVEIRDLTLALEDARSGRIWQTAGGRIDIRNGPEVVDFDIFTEIFNGTEDLASLQVSVTARKDGPAAIASVLIGDIPAVDIALQAPSLSFLGALEAPVSGAIRAEVRDDGTVEAVNTALEIGAGALRPTSGARPLPFQRGRAHLSYDPAARRIAFSELSVDSGALRMIGTGQAFLREFEGPWPGAIEAQFRMRGLEAAPEGLFDETVGFQSGHVDLRLRLDPFTVDFGQVVLTDGDTRFSASGQVAATEAGWRVALDASAPHLSPDRLMALWPVIAAPNTRTWLVRNVLKGVMTNIRAAVRVLPGRRPQFGLNWTFDAAEVRFLKYMPPITGGRGRAVLLGETFTLVTEAGEVVPGKGGGIDIAQSTLQIPSIFEKPGQARIGLSTHSSLTAALDLLNNRPVEVLRKSGRGLDIATARARLHSVIAFPLVKDLRVDQVDFSTTGMLFDLASTTLVPERELRADRLAISVSPQSMRLEGLVTLDGLPAEMVWNQPLTGGAPATGQGRVALSQEFLDTFNIALPPGTLSGAAAAELMIEVARDAPPTFRLASDLDGLGVSVDALGWAKAPDATGSLTISGQLGAAPEIDAISLEASGLAAEGRIVLAEDGAFRAAQFDRVRAGSWLDAPLTLSAAGTGVPPDVHVPSGTLDLRQRPDSGGFDGAPVPLDLALDRVIITDAIAATDVSAKITASAGLNGEFTGRINGGAPVRGVLVPRDGRTALRLQGDDGGAILRDAGIFKSFVGGAFDMTLVPRQEGPGYDGRLVITKTRLRDQPVMARLLDAISIVGIIDQLEGPGIVFDTVEARFRIDEDRLVLQQGSAVGASLGITLDGLYDMETRQLDLGGVISPVYLLNAIGQVFTRRGEGLFGFTYRVRGPANAPTVSVNPLSILTPGMFREIFRRAPPGE